MVIVVVERKLYIRRRDAFGINANRHGWLVEFRVRGRLENRFELVLRSTDAVLSEDQVWLQEVLDTGIILTWSFEDYLVYSVLSLKLYITIHQH